MPLTYFSRAAAECSLLFRDGYPYGCISLAQATAEALIRFLCERNSIEVTNHFRDNLRKLRAESRHVIPEHVENLLLCVWADRNDYHHLNPDVETDHRKLDELAKEKHELLKAVMGDDAVFGFEIRDGTIVPKKPEYWMKRRGS